MNVDADVDVSCPICNSKNSGFIDLELVEYRQEFTIVLDCHKCGCSYEQMVEASVHVDYEINLISKNVIDCDNDNPVYFCDKTGDLFAYADVG